MFVLGIPGQGKSWTVARVVGELSRQGVPALILDFHGQFNASGGALASASQETVLDAREGLPFSPFEVSPKGGNTVDWQTNALAIAEIFGYVCKLGDMQRDVVFTAVRDAYRARGFGGDADEEAAPVGYPTLRDVLGRIERQERAGRATNVAARCRALLEFDLFRPSEQPETNLLTLVRRGLVIDLHRLADVEVLQLAAGAFVLRKLYKDMFSWGEADRLRLVVVLDEAHRLAHDVTLPKLMKEGRKFGITVVVASQGIADFHPDILGSAGTKVIFRINHPDSRRVAGFIRVPPGVDAASRIEQLTIGEAYIQTPAMRLASAVRMEPPLSLDDHESAPAPGEASAAPFSPPSSLEAPQGEMDPKVVQLLALAEQDLSFRQRFLASPMATARSLGLLPSLKYALGISRASDGELRQLLESHFTRCAGSGCTGQCIQREWRRRHPSA